MNKRQAVPQQWRCFWPHAGIWVACAGLGLLQVGAQAPPLQRWQVVTEKSTFRIELGKTGWLKALGDDHLIEIASYQCKAQFDPSSPARGAVELTVSARALRVLDPQLSEEKRQEVQKKMEGPEVLDLTRFPTIRFISRRIAPEGPNRFRMEGDLQLRESTRSVVFNLTLSPESGGYRARGEVPVRLTLFGIQPPSAGGGSVKVKDEMKVVFDMLLVAGNN